MKNKKLIFGILIVVILVIVGISLFVLNRPAQEITITTDKVDMSK